MFMECVDAYFIYKAKYPDCGLFLVFYAHILEIFPGFNGFYEVPVHDCVALFYLINVGPL